MKIYCLRFLQLAQQPNLCNKKFGHFQLSLADDISPHCVTFLPQLFEVQLVSNHSLLLTSSSRDTTTACLWMGPKSIAIGKILLAQTFTFKYYCILKWNYAISIQQGVELENMFKVAHIWIVFGNQIVPKLENWVGRNFGFEIAGINFLGSLLKVKANVIKVRQKPTHRSAVTYTTWLCSDLHTPHRLVKTIFCDNLSSNFLKFTSPSHSLMTIDDYRNWPTKVTSLSSHKCEAQSPPSTSGLFEWWCFQVRPQRPFIHQSYTTEVVGWLATTYIQTPKLLPCVAVIFNVIFPHLQNCNIHSFSFEIIKSYVKMSQWLRILAW